MNLFRWLTGRSSGNGQDQAVEEWRREWRAAVADPDPSRVASLTASLDRLGLSADDAEIELEMLDGLTCLVELQASLASGDLPRVTTGHRVVGTDACHFIAPSSMPDEAAQPSGRLLLTGTKAIFVGGASSLAVPWHAVRDVVAQDRDVILVRRDRDSLHRFRCNVYADALAGGHLARVLAARHRRGAAPMPERQGADRPD